MREKTPAPDIVEHGGIVRVASFADREVGRGAELPGGARHEIRQIDQHAIDITLRLDRRHGRIAESRGDGGGD